MAKKILIVYATAGIGHKKAAMAVRCALDETAPNDIEVSIIDSLDYTNAFFKWIYLKVYLLMVNSLPLVWGLAYYITDNCYVNLLIAPMRRFNNWLNSGKLVKHLLETNPDVVISTHFFASEVMADMKRKGILKSRLVTVVTDYKLHSWWVSDSIDTYVVADLETREDLLRWKVPPEKIKALGIPTEPAFSRKLDREEISRGRDLAKDMFTVLVIGGGFGVGPIEDIVKTIGGVSRPVQIIAVCGHNKELVGRLELLKKSVKVRLNVLGFVDNVYEYMELSDILISKSGGITVSESLARSLPMVVISPIIGQETRNCYFLTTHGAAVKIDKVSEVKDVLEDLLAHPEKIAKMKEAIGRIRKPAACYDIAKLAIEMAGV